MGSTIISLFLNQKLKLPVIIAILTKIKPPRTIKIVNNIKFSDLAIEIEKELPDNFNFYE